MSEAYNPHQSPSTSYFDLLVSIVNNRMLIKNMVRRDILAQYKGSIFGFFWAFFNPIFLLIVYTFVFSVVFQARWGGDGEADKGQFALVLFVGLMVHGFFSEILNKSPYIITGNKNYVKKVVFPLDCLPVIVSLSALFNLSVNFLVMIVAYIIMNGSVHSEIIYFPLIVAPLFMLAMGISWFLASLGAYLRDISQFIGLITTVLLFLSPVFYPLSSLPEFFQKIVILNPLTLIIEQSRQVIIWGTAPNWKSMGTYYLVAIAVNYVGYYWFQKTRRGFADVI